MSETWRYVDCGAVDAFENNAEMAVLARSATDAAQPILQTSVWGATHLNVGWFDDVDSTLDLAACERLGIQVIRRPFAGGGTAFYDRGCAVMWGVMFPKPGDHDDLDAEIATFQPIVVDALDRLGLGEVRFEGSADLRWHGRKLGGLSAGDFGRVISVGGFLNIKPPDLDQYLRGRARARRQVQGQARQGHARVRLHRRRGRRRCRSPTSSSATPSSPRCGTRGSSSMPVRSRTASRRR